MSKLKVLSVSCMLALAALPGPVFAQYIYIDANGDGINTSADSLNAVGPTILTIYLSTNHDKDGSLQTCNSHSAANCGATGTAQPLNIFSYQIYLSAVGGTVTWGTFTPDSSAFATLQTQLQDTHDVEVTFARQPAGSISPPGLMALGKIPVTITSGSPSITFPRYPNTGLDANSFGTAFGTNCVAFTFGNSYVLGDRADSCGAVSGIPGDWFDADGAREPEGGGDGPEGPGGPDSPEQNRPPVIGSTPSVQQVEGNVVSVGVTAYDPDGVPLESLTADLSNLPAGNNATFEVTTFEEPGISGLTGDLRWTPGWYDEGTYRVIFTASNSMSSSDTTFIQVTNAPPPAPQLLSTRIQMPGPEYEIDVTYFRSTCGGGGACITEALFAGDSGQIYVPLLTNVGGALTWWQKIHIEFPAQMVAGYIALGNGNTEILSPTVEWYPSATFPGYTYVPSPNSNAVYALSHLIGPYHVLTAEYGVSAPKVPVILFSSFGSDKIQYISGDGIHWPQSHALFISQPGQLAEDWAMAHEYTHFLQDRAGLLPSDCAPDHAPFICDSILCPQTAWKEGMADGMADYYWFKSRGDSYSGITCNEHSVKSEWSSEKVIYFTSLRGAQAFWFTVSRATIRPNGEGFKRHVESISEFYSVWRDVNPDAAQIVDHVPGPFNIDYDYFRFVLGIQIPSAVEETDLSLRPDGIRMIIPNPIVQGRARIIVSSGKEVSWLEVYDLNGRLLRRSTPVSPTFAGMILPLDTSEFASGIYFVRLRTERGIVGKAKKIVVAK